MKSGQMILKSRAHANEVTGSLCKGRRALRPREGVRVVMHSNGSLEHPQRQSEKSFCPHLKQLQGRSPMLICRKFRQAGEGMGGKENSLFKCHLATMHTAVPNL